MGHNKATFDINKLTKYPVRGKLQPYVIFRMFFSMTHNNPDNAADTDKIGKARNETGEIFAIHDHSLPACLVRAHEPIPGCG
jgi:hypothetical protein